MSRVRPLVAASLVAAAVHGLTAGPARAQDAANAEPSVEPAAGEPPGLEPAPSPPPALQQPAPRPAALDAAGVDFAARVAYALPFGSVSATGGKLSDEVGGAVPLVLEVGYRLNAEVAIGALFQYAYALPRDSAPGCGDPNTCSGRVVRLGVEGVYNIHLDGALTPWIGVGTGYEWVTLSGSAGGRTASIAARGFELVTFQGGGDYRISPAFALGPFVSVSLADYAVETAVAPGVQAVNPNIADKRLHEWLQLGVRGRFGI